MFAHSAPEATARIVDALTHFLEHGKVTKVYFAEGHTAPPSMAFAVRFPRLSLTLEGADEMEIEQGEIHQTIRLGRGEAVYVPGQCWNKPTWRECGLALHLLFGEKHLGISLIDHNGKQVEPSRVVKSGATYQPHVPFKELLAAIDALIGSDSRTPLGQTLVTALLQATHQLFEQVSGVKGGKARNTFNRICLFLQENFQQDLTRKSVAEQFHLNPNHLSRLFRSEGQVGFNDYLARVRLERAKYLLQHHDLRIDELTKACGFSHTAYFCKVFKQRTNQTPTGYRSAVRAEDAPVVPYR